MADQLALEGGIVSSLEGNDSGKIGSGRNTANQKSFGYVDGKVRCVRRGLKNCSTAYAKKGEMPEYPFGGTIAIFEWNRKWMLWCQTILDADARNASFRANQA